METSINKTPTAVEEQAPSYGMNYIVRTHVWHRLSVRAVVRLGNHVWNCVTRRIKNRVWDRVEGRIRDSVWDRVEGRIRDSVWDRLEVRLLDRVGDSVEESVRNA